MNDEELQRLVAAAAAVKDGELARLPISGAEYELLEEIMSTPVPDPAQDVPGRQAGSKTRTRLRLSLVAAAVLAAVLAGSWLLPGGGGGASAFATEVAQANARVLVDAPGWVVVRVDEFTVEQGEMTFGDGSQELDVHWRASAEYEDFLDDRSHGNTRSTIEVLGETATMFRYGGTTDYTTILPPHGPNFLEIRGDLGSEGAYRAILDALTQVDVQTWLAALPASAIEPQERTETVAEMLQGIPLPAGFDPTSIPNTGGVSDRYQLGAAVTGAVTCAWVAQWQAAIGTGDDASKQQALTAMQSSRTWPILVEMDQQGDFPEAIWEIADEMVGGSLKTRWLPCES